MVSQGLKLLDVDANNSSSYYALLAYSDGNVIVINLKFFNKPDFLEI